MTDRDRERIVVPLPGDAEIPRASVEALGIVIIPTTTGKAVVVPGTDGPAYRFDILAATTPWTQLLYPDGKPIICSGIRFEATHIEWRQGSDAWLTTLCPRGAGNAGQGWTYPFSPALTCVVGINKVPCVSGNPCDNPRDVFSVAGPGMLTMGFNGRGGGGEGTCTVLVSKIYT